MPVPIEPSGFSLQPGVRVLGRYELVRELGRGGMGVVWLVKDFGLGIEVAFKFLPDVLREDRSSLDELRDEARRNLRLTNESIVRIYDFVEGPAVAGITMEYVDGDTLASRKVDTPERVLEIDFLRPLIRQLCKALHYAHTQPKVVHRDLKPANLMITRDGRLKITDFGIARSIADSVTRVSNAQASSGTLVYMSPQQLMGEPPQPTDDVYSVGATIYDLVTGKPPFYTGSVAAQLLQAVPPSMAERRAQLERKGTPIPDEWEDVVAACLSKDAASRPASALEIIRRLETGTTPRQEFDPGETIGEPIVVKPRRPSIPAIPPVPAPAPAPVVPPPSPVVTPATSRGTEYVAEPTTARLTNPIPPASVPSYQTQPTGGSSGGVWFLVGTLLALIILGIGVAGFYVAKNYLPTNGPGPGGTPPPPQTPEPVTTGRLLINTVPSQAVVELDGRKVGSTPLRIESLTNGDHRVHIEHEGYELLDLNIEVMGGQTTDPGLLHLVPRPKSDPASKEVVKKSDNSSNDTKVPPPPPVGLTDNDARQLVLYLLQATEERNVRGAVECYANPTDYYDEGVLSAAKLERSVSDYFKRWPLYDIQVLNTVVQSTDDPDEKVVKVDYRYVARKDSKVSSGIAHDTATVRRFPEGDAVRRIRQTVTDQSKNF